MNKTSKENSRSLYFFSSRPVQVCTRAFKQTLHEDSWSCFSQHLRRGGEIRSWYHVRGGSSKSEYNNKTAHRTHNNTVSWFIPLQSNSQNAHQTRWTKPRRKTRAHCTFFWSRPVLTSSPSLLSSHVLITLFGNPSPNLVVLLNVTKLWRVGLVNLSYTEEEATFSFSLLWVAPQLCSCWS